MTDTIDLAGHLSAKPDTRQFTVWIEGTAPLITHAWSHKARLEMLQKQTKAVKAGGREMRDPEADFRNSLYPMGMDAGEPVFGFPVTGIKNSILSAAHKDKGIPKTTLQSALYLRAAYGQTVTAMPGAVCDQPLVRIYGGQPVMREDMVRVGTGLNKTASLAYRAQFAPWAIKLEGTFNAKVLTAETLAMLLNEAGQTVGIGEWRPERRGVFGTYAMAQAAEWEAFAKGEGPLPGTVTPQAAE